MDSYRLAARTLVEAASCKMIARSMSRSCDVGSCPPSCRLRR